MSRIAAVIPTYNRAGWVVEAVESVLAQTRAVDEIVVVDDGSTDDTAERMRAYGGRVRVLRQDNAGVSAARNRGWQAATSDLIGFLDSDDRWEPGAVAAVEAELEAHPRSGVVALPGRLALPDGTPGDRVLRKRTPGPSFDTAGLLQRDAGGCSWIFARRELLERVGGYDEELRSAEDNDLVLRLSFVTRLRSLEEPLLLRRWHDENLSWDLRLNADCWIRLLRKLERDQPEWVEQHGGLFQKAAGKAYMRLGRELLATGDPSLRSEARAALRHSLRLRRLQPRVWRYLAWSVLAPSKFPRIRGFRRYGAEHPGRLGER